MFWVHFTPIGIVDIVTFPPGEALDPSSFMEIVLDSLNKKRTNIPDPNPEKCHCYIWIMPDSIWSTMKFKQTTSPGCHIQPRFGRGRFLAFRVSKSYTGRGFIRNDRGTARHGNEHFPVDPDIDP
jgi:hypothetical protein